MIVVRSLLFQVLQYGWTTLACLVLVPMLLGSQRQMQDAARVWAWGILWLARVVVGLHYEVRGGPFLPTGAAVVASKHQSMWETLVFHTLLPNPVFILKRELTRIPFFGWYLIKAGSIAIDRDGGASALKRMAEATRKALANGSQVIIFPEGTRTSPGEKRPYQPGVGLLYGLGAPVVPTALNSGVFWGRHTFLRKPGTILLEFMPAIPAGLERRVFLKALEDTVESAADRLRDEAFQP